MNPAVSFITPGGEEMVILSRKDYDALLRQVELAEDAEDLQSIRQYEASAATGQQEVIPAEFVRRLVEGENPVRVWRDFRKLSAKEVATVAGISAAYLSEIETGKKEGSVSVLRNIAKVLHVELEDLLRDRNNA